MSSGPRTLGLAVESLARSLAPDTLLGRVQQAWAGAVGPAIAAEARPIAERGGIVTVACRSSVWAQELDLLSPQLLDRLEEALGPGCVTRLRCVATLFEDVRDAR